MITIHHLGVSQSDRIVWVMEELELPYELKWYDRGEDFLAPQSYRDLHPVGTAPIITDAIWCSPSLQQSWNTFPNATARAS